MCLTQVTGKRAETPAAIIGLLLAFPFLYISAGVIASSFGVSTAVFLSTVYAATVLPYTARLQNIEIDSKVSLGWVLLVMAIIYLVGTEDRSRGGATTAFIFAGVLMAALIKRHQSYWAAIKALAVGFALFSVLMIVTVAAIEQTLDVVVQPRFGYLQGTISSDPNVIGFFLAALSLSLAAGLACHGKELFKSRLHRSLWCGVVAWLVIVLVMTQSRSALIGFAAGSSCILLRRSLRSPAAAARLAALIAAVLVLATVAVRYTDTALEEKYGRIDEDTRVELWNTALRAWGGTYQTLLVGAGTGAAHREIGKHYPEAKTYDSEFPVYNPHSTIVEWILQFGIAGLLFSVLFIVQGVSFLIQGVTGRVFLPAGVVFAPILMFFMTYGVSSVPYAPVVYFLWLSSARFSAPPPIRRMDVEEHAWAG